MSIGIVDSLCDLTGNMVRPWAEAGDQCAQAEVPLFFKQWGEWSPERPADYCKLTNTRYSHAMFSWAKDGSVYNPLNPPDNHFPSVNVWRVGKKAAGALLDGREHREIPRA